jgi:streptogramin lyase
VGGVLGSAVVALAVALVLVGHSGPAAQPAADRLSVHPVVQLPAASAVAQSGGRAWATDDLDNEVVQFDPATGHVVRRTLLDGRPVALLYAQGDLWVANMVSNAVQEISPRTGRIIRALTVPAGPSDLVDWQGRIWCTSIIAGSVSPLDPRRGTVGQAVPVPGGAVREAAGFGALWVTGTTDQLTELVPGSAGGPLRLHIMGVGSGPIGVATGEGSVWVADASAGTVRRVDPTSRRITHTYRLGGDPLVISVAAGRVWVADGSAQTLRTIFPGRGVRAVDLHAGPRDLLPVGHDMWVATSNPGRVLAVSALP